MWHVRYFLIPIFVPLFFLLLNKYRRAIIQFRLLMSQLPQTLASVRESPGWCCKTSNRINRVSEISIKLTKIGVLTEHLLLSIRLNTLNVNQNRIVNLRWICRLLPWCWLVDGRATSVRHCLWLLFYSSHDAISNRNFSFVYLSVLLLFTEIAEACGNFLVNVVTV